MRTIRDQVQEPITIEYFQRRLSEGWKLREVEWEKDETVPTEHAAEGAQEEAPYGLEIADAVRLQRNLQEVAVLLTILEMIVAEKRVPLIADELNQRGYRTRSGARWTATQVFDLLPRVIDMGPELLKSAAWQQRRSQIRLQ